MTEHELQNGIISFLKAQGLYILRVNSGVICDARTGTYIHLAERGSPDLLCSRLDKTLGFIEVKSTTGVLSPDQITQLRAIGKLGLAWLVADDLTDVDKWLHDAAFHGKPKHTDAVRDKFAYSAVPYRRKGRLSSSQMLDFELWSRKKDDMHKG